MSRLQGSFMSPTKKKSIGGRIEVIRGDLGVAEFASALGINRKTVTRWEADESLPDGASLLALRDRFGADPGWILSGEGEPPSASKLTPDEQVLLDGYRTLDQGTRRRMLAFILGGTPPAANQQSHSPIVVTASGFGTQAAGRKIINQRDR